jgi:hypothetical protein
MGFLVRSDNNAIQDILSSLVPGSFYSTTLISGTMAAIFGTSLLLREVKSALG